MLPVYEAMSPDERLAAGRCPECAVDLKLVDPQHHAVLHWGDEIPHYPEYAEARKRKAMLMSYKKEAK